MGFLFISKHDFFLLKLCVRTHVPQTFHCYPCCTHEEHNMSSDAVHPIRSMYGTVHLYRAGFVIANHSLIPLRDVWAGYGRRMAQRWKIMKLAMYFPSANHGAGICTPTFARTKSPSFAGKYSIHGVDGFDSKLYTTQSSNISPPRDGNPNSCWIPF